MAEINFIELSFISDFNRAYTNLIGGEHMPKKAVIVISLVEESAEKANEEIEKEILEELSKHPPMIP